MNSNKLCENIIHYSFYLLFFAVPLFWLPINSELFELNKMLLVYFLTIVIGGTWIIKGLSEREFIVKRTPADIPILLFLLANILSTIFSIDPHTSIFGYYGRFNGGLLSTISYIVLFYALVSSSNKKQIINYFFVTFVSGAAVAIYAILQHPNPIFATVENGKRVLHGIDFNYWAVDVESRVFSTLGQPNWLAAFLAMIIFPLLSFLFNFERFWQKLLIFLLLCASFLAFTFTFSRGGTVGIAFGFLTFILLLPFFKESFWKKVISREPFLKLGLLFSRVKKQALWILGLIVFIAIVNSIFGNALAIRGGLSTAKTNPNQHTKAPAQTQLEVGGAQTATIRTIVWTGAIEIFKHNPLLGTGVETFGYSYYLFRPATHNLTAEWDYLYNKAHNEYLNTLANTGLLGFLTYLLLIASFEFFALKTIVGSGWNKERLLGIGILAGYNSYLAQNFFGFGVVPITLLFFLYPGMFFILTGNLNNKFLTVFSVKKWQVLNVNLYNKVLKFCVIIVGTALAISIFSMWLADFFYNKGTSETTYQETLRNLNIATKLFPQEPRFQAELATNLSSFAVSLNETEKNNPDIKKSSDEARTIINKTVAENPNNTFLWQSKRTVDYNLSKINQANYLELLRTAETLKRLAPTDASTQYDVALVYSLVSKPKDAESQLERVVKLKEDYSEAVLMLARVYQQNGKADQAINTVEKYLKKNPTDIQALELLKTLKTS